MNSTQDEQERLATLRGYGVLDSPNEVQFDTIVRDAARALGTPIALISLIDENRQWFKAKVGLAPRETPRSISFCTHAIRGNDIMIVHDATLDDRFSGNPLVTGDIGIRFYAGAPLKTEDGKRIGTLCVIDTKAHPSGMTERDRATLESLARRTIQALKLRRAAQTASWSFPGALGGGPMRERSVQCSAFTASGALKAERPLAPRSTDIPINHTR